MATNKELEQQVEESKLVIARLSSTVTEQQNVVAALKGDVDLLKKHVEEVVNRLNSETRKKLEDAGKPVANYDSGISRYR